ncbi:MarR family winged helix-turn-helix transcriptional regulator [Stackebrandtia soli]|uniref:MarR family winged helix-turn-helix transcriptional regulator n=1 Tax=Stackebrandtia soli TaxID=1892856 RepID=UPI0039E78896
MYRQDGDPADLIERALVRIRREQQRQRLHRKESAAPTPANAAKYRALDALDAADGLSISQLAEAIGVDRPRASRIAAALIDDEFAARTHRDDDARVVVIHITEPGRTIVSRVRRTRLHNVEEALAEFTPEEAHTLASLLDRFITAWPR